MNNDILIKNIHVIDPYRRIDGIENIRVLGDKIVDEIDVPASSKTLIIDGKDYIATPGLIDFHAHVFYDGTEGGVRPDVYMLPNGVTTVVDAGSAGTANFESFYKNVICTNNIRIKAFIAVSPSGQICQQENYNPQFFDKEKISYLFNKYPDVIQGIKLKIQKENVFEYGLEPLLASLAIAESISCPIAVHITNPIVDTADFIKYFRNGDIIAHTFHGKGCTILDEHGNVLKEVLEAKQRGVIFDAANGRSHFSINVAKKSIQNGFYPDVISSDLSSITNLKWPVYSLPWILSKYLALGMRLTDIIASCTSFPAKLLGMEKKIGTLCSDAFADISLFKLKEKNVVFEDIHGEGVSGNQLLVPQLTIKSGEVVFRQMDF